MNPLLSRHLFAFLCLGLSLHAQEYKAPPTFAEVQAQLETWQHEHPSKLKLEVPGKSVQGRPVFACVLTDSSVPPDDKEHVLITTTHSGIEKGATVAALEIIKWLLGSDAAASEVLRRQTVIIMPVCNPDGYVKPSFTNDHGHDDYMDWNAAGPQHPAQMPEAVAMQKIMDQGQPEVFSDIHGNDMSFPGYIHFEGHVNNPSLRSYEPEIERLMDEAALAAGYPTHRGEADEQRLFTGAVPGITPDKQARKKPRIFAGTYCYLKYHTLTIATENAWPHSALARHQRLLRIGNEVWPGEQHPGYPTRTILTHSHQIVAHGKTAAERRASRIELWNKQSLITHGFSNPQIKGFTMHVVATTPAAAEKWLADPTLKGFQKTLQSHPGVNHAEILHHLADHPDGPGQWGTEAKLALVKPAGKADPATRIEHGLAIRLRIPFAKSTLEEVRLNGEIIKAATWTARGYRYVEVAISPEHMKKQDFWIVTCRYDSGEKRAAGDITQ
jgi:hypothetical protein